MSSNRTTYKRIKNITDNRADISKPVPNIHVTICNHVIFDNASIFPTPVIFDNRPTILLEIL